MTKDPKKIREIARICAVLSKSAATPKERNEFEELANKWQKFATNRDALAKSKTVAHRSIHQTTYPSSAVLDALTRGGVDITPDGSRLVSKPKR